MAKFGGLTVTRGGMALLSKALVGKLLRFSRVTVGDGFLPEGQDKKKMTEPVHFVRDLPIHSITVPTFNNQNGEAQNVGTATIQAVMTNQGIQQGFFVRELGLFAQDPDTGVEVLYAYGNAGNEADYLPGENGPDAVQYLISLVTVVDRAKEVTAVISSGMIFATQEELNMRINELFGVAAPIFEFWTRRQGDDKKLRPAGVAEVKRVILGETDIDSMNRRVEYIEDIIAQILLELEVANIYPEYERWICEDFRVPDQVDLFRCKVIATVAGDDSLDCMPIDGIIPFSCYTLTDGVSNELVWVRSVNVEHGIQRVLLTAPVRNTYRLEDCRLVRSSATIRDGKVYGPRGTQSLVWAAETTFKGLNANTPITLPLDMSFGQSWKFECIGTTFTSDGLVTIGG